MKNILRLSVVALLAFQCIACSTKKTVETPLLIPQPKQITNQEGYFEISSSTQLVAKGDAVATAKQFQTQFESVTGENLEITESNSGDNTIEFALDNSIVNSEGYTVNVTNKQIRIAAKTNTGLYYGVQTVKQLLPSEIFSTSKVSDIDWTVPAVSVEDAPRYAWRGMMLDCSRHFFTKEYIKQHIDWMSEHKLNTFHWHLIDDQGWRLEIKKFPKLTESAAWRVDHEDKSWNARPDQKEGDKATYGGFYTQEDVKEVVAYAAARHITVVPEIEMPAHITCAFSAYPEYSCQGKKLTVPTGGLWPITDIYCAGNDKTFEFLEGVLDEVFTLFPSKYIHIGGDEANKQEWETCPKCKKRMRKEGLKNTHELQSYFIERIEKYINKNGRNMIGWDEILEGGLAPNAAVMSWRGMDGGIKAAKAHHPVVMTPTHHCYFDYYQGDRDFEPEAFGATLRLKKVYDFDPTPKELTAEEAKYVLGGQANLWTEHVPTPEHAQYMTYPRLTAMSEALWSTKENKDWESFQTRLVRQLERYTFAGINYAKSAYAVKAKSKFNKETKSINIELAAELNDGDILFTTDGSEPTAQSTVYTAPISITETTEIKAVQIKNGEALGIITSYEYFIHKATSGAVTYNTDYNKKYKAHEAFTLVNSTTGTKNFSDGEWQGFYGEDLDVVIDLHEVKEINSISAGFLSAPGSWIFLPKNVEYLSSTDGKNFDKLGELNTSEEEFRSSDIKRHTLKVDTKEARYIKVIARNYGVCPEWHKAAGDKAYLFTDEIIVE